MPQSDWTRQLVTVRSLQSQVLDPLQSLIESIPWPLVSKTRLYKWVTTPSASPLFPPHILISNTQFLLLFFGAGISLYSLFITPFPRTTRSKQILAFPLLTILLAVPMMFTCPTKVIHVGMAVTGAAVGQRMVDLYYVQPWTGVPTRGVLIPGSIRESQEKDNSPKESTSSSVNGSVTLSPTSTGTVTNRKATKPNGNGIDHAPHTKLQTHRDNNKDDIVAYDKESFLNWDKNRFLIEMWLPLRKFSRHSSSPLSSSSSSSLSSSSSSSSTVTVSSTPDLSPTPRFISGRDILVQALLYKFSMDWILYFLSDFTPQDVLSLRLSQYAGFVALGGGMIMVMILWVVYSDALIYAYSQNKPLDLKEWTMLTTYLPCFATSPAEFWSNWHTLLRYIWVDLGFLPVQRFCRRQQQQPQQQQHHLTSDRHCLLRNQPNGLAKAAEEAFPILAVFMLSGLLHVYIVYAIWRESGWSQIFYFSIQGIAVILTRVVERSEFGKWVGLQRQGARWKKRVVDLLGFGGMIWFHVLTVPFFVHPYLMQGMWIDIKELSPIWWILAKK